MSGVGGRGRADGPRQTAAGAEAAAAEAAAAVRPDDVIAAVRRGPPVRECSRAVLKPCSRDRRVRARNRRTARRARAETDGHESACRLKDVRQTFRRRSVVCGRRVPSPVRRIFSETRRRPLVRGAV